MCHMSINILGAGNNVPCCIQAMQMTAMSLYCFNYISSYIFTAVWNFFFDLIIQCVALHLSKSESQKPKRHSQLTQMLYTGTMKGIFIQLLCVTDGNMD